jgi:quercetin dioxygenase-like cupin family protein
MGRYFVRRSERSRHALFPGVEAFTMAGQHILLSWVELAPGAIVERHCHPHEQLGMLIEGTVVFEIDGESQTLEPGDTWRIPGDVPHRVVAGDLGAKAVDVFHPVREDYL